MSTKEPITSSFNALKRRARCNQDIVDWLNENSQYLPDVPEHLVPHLVVYIDTNNSFVGLDINDDSVEGRVTILYSAQLPDEPQGVVTSLEFEKLLSTKVRIDKVSHTRPAIHGKLRLYLDPVEWPFVAANAGWDVLTDHDSKSNLFPNKTREMWPKAFPTIPWDFVLDIYNAGLAPESLEDFTDWIFDKAFPQPNTTSLPSDFTP